MDEWMDGVGNCICSTPFHRSNTTTTTNQWIKPNNNDHQLPDSEGLYSLGRTWQTTLHTMK